MNSSEPDIAIVIPAYNAELYLGDAIKSVIAQSYTHWQLAIVDDGSSDSTASIAQRYVDADPRITLHRQANFGVSAARNFGYVMSASSAVEVLFLDSDDILEVDALAALHAALAKAPQASAVYGLARYINADGALIRPGELEQHQRARMGVEAGRVVKWPANRPTTFAVEAVMEYIITPGTVLMRRPSLELAGLFREDLRLWEDWDLWLRLSRIAEMVFHDHPVLQYRRHEGNLSNASQELEEGESAVRWRLFDSLDGKPDLMRIAEIGYRYQQMTIAKRRLGWAGDSLAKAQVVPAARQLRHAAKRLVNAIKRPEFPSE